jgi:hypothetical protein
MQRIANPSRAVRLRPAPPTSNASAPRGIFLPANCLTSLSSPLVGGHMRIQSTVAVLALCVAACASAQQLHRCTDVSGRVTYTDAPCASGAQKRVTIVDNSVDASDLRDKAMQMRAEREKGRESIPSTAVANRPSTDATAVGTTAAQQECLNGRRDYEMSTTRISRHLAAMDLAHLQAEQACGFAVPRHRNHDQAELDARTRTAVEEKKAARKARTLELIDGRSARCDRSGCNTAAGRVYGDPRHVMRGPDGVSCQLFAGSLTCR